METFTTVTVRTRPLVKSYLENNFGDPVLINERHVLNKLAISQLFKANARSLTGGQNDFKEYTEEIRLCIGKNNFLYDGYMITGANSRLFNEGVKSYMDQLIRTNLDSLLLSQEKQMKWKQEFTTMINLYKADQPIPKELAAFLRAQRAEIEKHELNIKTAIDYVVEKVLKVSVDLLPYETVKKNYYRYRNPEKYAEEKKRNKIKTPLQGGLDLFSQLDDETIN